MDRLSALKVFAEVARRGGFSAAAEALDMSRAMVTRHVMELEQWLGVRLLQRTTRRVSLTDAGEQCLLRAEYMLALAEEMAAEVAPADGMLRGRLRLTCSLSFAQAQLAAALSAFLSLHPQLKVELDAGDRAVNLLEARVDLAIRIGNEADPGLVARPLGRCDSALVAAPAYLARHGLPLRPADLVGHRCLGHTRFGRNAWTLARDGVVEQVAVACHFTANDAVTLVQAAVAEGGIALVPTYLASPLLANGSLRPVLAEWAPPALTVQALYPSRKHLSPALRALLDFLVAYFAQPRW